MLVVDPARRSSLMQVKRHKWMSVMEAPEEQLLSPQQAGGTAFAEPVINEQILRLMQSLGVDPVKTKESVTHQRYDHHAAIYYLLLERRIHLTSGVASIVPTAPAGATDSSANAAVNKPIRRPTSWTHR